MKNFLFPFKKTYCLGFLLLLFSCYYAGAQVANDLCTDAISINCGETVQGSTTTATFDAAGFCGTSNTAPGVWYQFTGNNQIALLSTCNQADYDTKISVFTGSCDALECVTGLDDAPGCAGFTTELDFLATAGEDYFILVHGFSSATGNFSLSLTCTDAAGNDLCSGALPISCGETVSGSTVGATFDNVGFCGTSNTTDGVWYTFTGQSGVTTLSTCNQADYDTKISIFTGSCDELECVAGQDDNFGAGCAGFTTELDFCTADGVTYYALVHGFSNATGDFDLTMTCAPYTGPPLEVLACPDEQTVEGCGSTDAIFIPAPTVFCDVAKFSPGFPDDLDCEASICFSDPFCCNNFWDGLCATAAATNPACYRCVSSAPAIAYSPLPVSVPLTFFQGTGGSVTGGCGDVSVIYFDESTQGCSLVVTRTFILTDEAGFSVSCQQTINIVDPDLEPPTVSVVPNLTVDCFEAINPNPAWAEASATCEKGVEVSVSGPIEQISSNCPGTTYTYIFTATDECGISSTATQTYHIENNGPTMDCPDNCEVFGCYDGQAQAVIDAWINTVTATSSCNDALTVSNSYTLSGNVLNGICITDGITPVTFTAVDDCGRDVSCESLIIIMDDDAPEITGTPSELLVPCTANTDEALAAWLATQGGVSAYDECSSVTWSTDPVDPLALLDCESGPQAIVVEFIATDECGNSASVTGVFNTKLLPLSVNVAGLIQTEVAEAVASVEVAAYQSSGMTAMDMTNESGDYGFEDLPFEENTEIVPARNGDWLNGLSTYDLILLQMHVLGVQELDSPYKRIAADANRSGTISTLDLVLLRRLILHLDEELEDNTSWRFVDANFVFPNPQDPFETEFPEAYNLTGEEEDWASFVAVKIGDLNLDAETNSFNTGVDDRSGLEDLVFEIEDQKLQAGEEYEIELHAVNFNDIRGFQLTLEYDHSLAPIAIAAVLDGELGGGLPDFDESNYNLAYAGNGKVPISWHSTEAMTLSTEDVAFRILIKANADINLSEALTITSSPTRAEAYSSTDLMNVALQFTYNGTNVSDNRFLLFQNQPNPFKDATMIAFVLPEDGEVTLEIFDVNGRLVHSQRGDYPAGYQQIELDRASLPTGVLYYQVSTAAESASKKMIVLD